MFVTTLFSIFKVKRRAKRGRGTVSRTNFDKFHASRNISKTSASVSSGFPNTRKLMKARGRRPSAFIVFECLETPMKHEARVFEIASQTCIMNQELVTDRMRCLNMRRLVK